MEERNYETVCIVKTDAGEDSAKQIIQKSTSSIEAGKGNVVRVDEWGRRRLAYPIEKKNEGYYFVLNYTSGPEVTKELERILNLNEDVLRFQTVKVKEFSAPAEAAAEASGEKPAGGEKAAEASAEKPAEGEKAAEPKESGEEQGGKDE